MSTQTHAINIVQKLVRHGYIAYFAGGWVRDFIMHRPSDDIDIATNATPEVILDLFPRTILVGLQFGVVIVAVDGLQFEVASFRKDLTYTNGRKPDKIEYSTPEEDALRRDFTINGMFYDPLENKIHDYVGGRADIEKRVVRTIGDPQERFFEDRLRMLRAFRFAAKFDFTINLETQEAIRENADRLLPAVAMERIWQEFTKMSKSPRFAHALSEMHRLGILQAIFPELAPVHLKEIIHRLKPLDFYPLDPPPALFLQELFPEKSVDELITLGKYLKIPNKDISQLAFYVQNRPFAFKSRYAGVQFYAHPLSSMCLQIYACRLAPEEKRLFLDKHAHDEALLEKHIRRNQNKRPVVTAHDLIAQGIPTGVSMGQLLKFAEEIAIEKDCHSTDDILHLLRQSRFWPSGAA